MNICETKSLSELFQLSLRVPEYQRDYAWDEKYVKQLLKSLAELEQSSNPLIMGTIILWKNENDVYEIVDGQQRLVTFLLINIVLSDNIDSWHETVKWKKIEYADQKAKDRLRKNYELIQRWKQKHSEAKATSLFDRTLFTVIYAQSQDEAFLFFDSQNNRGKALRDFDLLKANHLRFVPDNDGGKLQRNCAELWEDIENEGKQGQKAFPTMEYLMNELIAFPRRYSQGGNKPWSLLEDFQCRRKSANESKSAFPLSNYNQPAIFTKLEYRQKENALELTMKPMDAWFGTKKVRIEQEAVRYLPFQLTQKFGGGEQFFWFVKKYQLLYIELFVDRKDRTLSSFYAGFEGLRNGSSEYVWKLFETAMLFWADKFSAQGEEFLLAALYLVHAIFWLQVKQVVQWRSVDKYLRDVFNPFRKIHEAGTPDFFFQEMEGKLEECEWYGALNKKLNGRMAVCLENLQAFYHQANTMQWLTVKNNLACRLETIVKSHYDQRKNIKE